MKIRFRPAANRGFTLMETLVALMVLAIGLTVVLQLFSGGMKAKARSEDYTRAMIRASDIMEEVLGATDMAEETLSGETDDGFSWQAFISEYQEETDEDEIDQQPLPPAGAGLFQVDLVVSWKNGDRTKSVELSTMAMVPRRAQ